MRPFLAGFVPLMFPSNPTTSARPSSGGRIIRERARGSNVPRVAYVLLRLNSRRRKQRIMTHPADLQRKSTRLRYSYFNAVTGSTRIARRAGM